jgi:hypothetical protein
MRFEPIDSSRILFESKSISSVFMTTTLSEYSSELTRDGSFEYFVYHFGGKKVVVKMELVWILCSRNEWCIDEVVSSRLRAI